MKFFSYLDCNLKVQYGVVIDEINGLNLSLKADLPKTLQDLILKYDQFKELIDKYIKDISDESLLNLDLIKYEPPVRPKKNVFNVGRNYVAHIIEGNLARGRDPNDFPKKIEFFTKSTNTLNAHKSGVVRHSRITTLLDYEVELGIVIGKEGTNIPLEKANEYIFGYTIINDITARDLQKDHGQWFKGKSLDTTCPVGPFIVTADEFSDIHNLNIQLYVNDELRQSSNTRDMLFDCYQIVSELSQGLTLEAGDLIATGTPEGVGFALTPPVSLSVGDKVIAKIENIGTLENIVIEG